MIAIAEQAFPFDGGTAVNQAQWTLMARQWLGTCVVKGGLGTDLAVTAPGGAMSVNVGLGQAYLQGFFYQNDASKAVTITAADPSLPRIDRIVVHLDMTAKTIVAQVLTGTAAGSPVAPTLTQTSTIWEISLCQVRVNAAVTQVITANLTDERPYSTIWTAANMGIGSGLDADKLQGVLGSLYALKNGSADMAQNSFTANGTRNNGAGNYAFIGGAVYFDGGLLKSDGSGGLLLAKLKPGTGAYINGIGYPSGTGSGTFSHGAGITPQAVLPVDSQSSASMTVGTTSYGSTTFVITTGASHTWVGVALG